MLKYLEKTTRVLVIAGLIAFAGVFAWQIVQPSMTGKCPSCGASASDPHFSHCERDAIKH